MADGALRHSQFIRRLGEALVPGSGLEGFQGVERGQTTEHEPLQFMRNSKACQRNDALQASRKVHYLRPATKEFFPTTFSGAREMLRNGALGFVHIHTDVADRSTEHTAHMSWPVMSDLRTIWGYLREGLAAHRHYERLRSRGVPHATALREALGFGPSSTDDAATSR